MPPELDKANNCSLEYEPMFDSATPTRRGRTVPKARAPRRGASRRGPWGFLVKLAVISLLVGAVMTQVVLGTAGSRGPSVTVQPGQTLWGIAVQHYPDSDPRAAISAIESANHLKGAGIAPGERLLLPPV